MLVVIIRTLVLLANLHAIRPDAPLDRLLGATYAAAIEETPDVPAEFLLAIADHESDLAPRTVSYRTRAGRVDLSWDGMSPIAEVSACGLVQSIARSRASCAALLEPRAAMRAGVAELAEELARCRGVMSCALSIYAGGRAGLDAWRSGEDTDATRFAWLFMRNARRLGWSPRRTTT